MKKFLPLFLAFKLYAAFPDYYYHIKSIKQQKKAFVDILLPLIQQENKNILKIRKKVIEIFKDPFYLLDKNKIEFLTKIAKRYNIKDINDKKSFLIKIDKIPPSLALAQAAIESGWGKSRFVKEANNIFGHWEYSNKGIKPKSTYAHIKINYSLKKFNSLEDSIKAYMLNLNRNPAYIDFRKKRYLYHKLHKKFTGIDAAPTLKNYSQLKEEYVKRLQNMIKINKWQQYDK